MKYIIETGKDHHLPDVLGLIKDLAEFEKAPESVTNTLDRMRSETDYFDFFVATVDGEVVGTAVYFFAYYTWVGKSLYLDDLYVKPEFRGNKVASALLARIFDTARKHDCQRVRWQVLDWNSNAIELYKKLGARLDGEWLNCDFTESQIVQVADHLNE